MQKKPLKSRLKRGGWRSKRRIAVIALAIVLVAIVGMYIYIVTRPQLLEITAYDPLTKKPLTNGGTISITIKNISTKDVTFTNTGYDLVFERQEGSWLTASWQHVADFSPSYPESRVLRPGESVALNYNVDKTWTPAFSSSGRYRVGTQGVYAEFTLEWLD